MTDNIHSVAYMRYATAKEYVEAVKLVLTSPHYRDRHVMMAIRPTHLLAGFALELYLKAWLLADGEAEQGAHGHKLLTLYENALGRGFSNDDRIRELIGHIAEPHGQNRDYVYRYTAEGAEIKPLIWDAVLPIIDQIDNLVDAKVGASAHHGLAPGH